MYTIDGAGAAKKTHLPTCVYDPQTDCVAIFQCKLCVFYKKIIYFEHLYTSTVTEKVNTCKIDNMVFLFNATLFLNSVNTVK